MFQSSNQSIQVNNHVSEFRLTCSWKVLSKNQESFMLENVESSWRVCISGFFNIKFPSSPSLKQHFPTTCTPN